MTRARGGAGPITGAAGAGRATGTGPPRAGPAAAAAGASGCASPSESQACSSKITRSSASASSRVRGTRNRTWRPRSSPAKSKVPYRSSAGSVSHGVPRSANKSLCRACGRPIILIGSSMSRGGLRSQARAASAVALPAIRAFRARSSGTPPAVRAASSASSTGGSSCWTRTPCRCRSACDEALRVASRRRQTSARIPADCVAAATTRASKKASFAASGFAARSACSKRFEKTLVNIVTSRLLGSDAPPASTAGPAHRNVTSSLCVYAATTPRPLCRKWRIVAAAALTNAPWTAPSYGFATPYSFFFDHFVKSTPSMRTQKLWQVAS
jgi:hypothetical protein